MSRDTNLVPSGSGLCDTLLQSFSYNKMHSQGLPSSLSGRLSPAVSGFGIGLEESGRLDSFNADTSSGDHIRITMKTRVAVRDKNPHRFQVVPLRDVARVSLCQSELSGQLKGPHTSTSYLRCAPSRNILSYSQPKTVCSSPSATPTLWGNNAKENRTSGGRGTESNSIKSLGSLNSRIDSSLLSFPTLPSLSQDEKNVVLGELDLNRPETKSSTVNRKSGISLQLENSSLKAVAISSSPSKDSPNEPSSSGGLAHTVSQSFHVKSRYDTRCLKFTSLSNIPQSDYISSGSTAVSNKMEPFTDSVKLSGREPEPKAKCLSATFAGQGNTKQSSNKRHAMYTPSLFLPYFQKLALSEDNPTLDGSRTSQIEEARLGHQFDHDKTICQELQDFGTRLDDQDTPRRILQDPFEILPSGLIDFFPIDSPLHHSSPKATSGDLSSYLGLAYDESLSAEQVKNTLDSQSDGIVYPEVILHLFLEIDKAIGAWSAPVV